MVGGGGASRVAGRTDSRRDSVRGEPEEGERGDGGEHRSTRGTTTDDIDE